MELEDYDEHRWSDGRRVDEALFCKEFIEYYNLISVNGNFYSTEGLITDENIIRKNIYEMLKPCVRCGIAKKVESLLSALRIAAQQDMPEEDEYVIHVANGTYHLIHGFSPEKQICRHRLPVRYSGSSEPSQVWQDFLEQLLEPEDIITLQEYLGYCLISTNKAQRMLMILGRGGEGKSRIGVAMKAILGSGMNISSMAKIESSPFARADLEHLLLMVDDDLKMEALGSTNYIKSIITADLPMDVERKGIQSYQGKIHARFLAFGNGSLQALHDRSYGFFRRQIILTAKPRDPNRVDDPYLGERLAVDAEKIFIWCLFGLYRLIENDYRFTISQRTDSNWEQAVATQNNAVEFMRSEGYIQLRPDGKITARRLYELYRLWCEDNALKPLGSRSFSSHLIANAEEYGITYCNTVPIHDGKRARGFMGIAPVVTTEEIGR